MSGEEAIQNILQFVEEESGEEESDLDELYGDENDISSDTNIFLKKKIMILTQMKMQILSLDVNIGVSN